MKGMVIKMKRIISAVVSAVMLVALFASCTITVKEPAPSDTSESTAGTVHGAAETNAAAESSESTAGAASAVTPEIGDMDLLYGTAAKFTQDMKDCEFRLYGRKSSEGFYEEMLLWIGEAAGGQHLFSASFPAEGSLDGAHILLEDANFDGYMDVLITEGPRGAHGNLSYRLLLWSGAENALQAPEESFSEILNPVIDGKDQVIRSLAANSAFEDCYQIYRYQDGEYRLDLELIVTRGEVNGKETLTFTPYQYAGGVPQPLSVLETFGPPDPSHPDMQAYYGEDSLWKLDDPIWFNSAHFKGVTENTPPKDGFYSGVLLEGSFYHDGRGEWLTYYYLDVGMAQYDILNGELGGVEDLGQPTESEIQVYTTDESIRLGDHIGQRIMFKGEFFEAHTIYHRRNIVFEIKELGNK